MGTEAPAERTQSPLSVRDQAIHTGLAFAQALSFRRGDRAESRRLQQTMWRLRDSMSYRAEALDWHASLLAVLHRSAIRRLMEGIPGTIQNPQPMYVIANEHHWVFDDLAFNAIALFDYIGNIVGFSFYGDHRRKLKWDGAQKCARDAEYDQRKNPRARIYGSATGSLILRTHQDLVKGLSDYRADIIHYQARLGSAHLKTTFGGPPPGVAFDLTVTAPSEFIKRFAGAGHVQGGRAPTIAECAAWLVGLAEGHARAVLRSLEMDLLREVGADPLGRATHVEIF